MNLLIAPISGPLFAAQIASIWELTKCGYKPDLCFVGSGGGVATFVAKAAYWNPSKLFAVASALSTECFVSEWTSSSVKVVPSALASLIHGTVYKSTNTGMNILCEHLSEHTSQDVEVWIAAINEETGKVLLSCNKNREDCIIKGDKLGAQLFEYEALAYLGGNLEEISKAILASACIPVLVEPIKIDNCNYVDCGVKYGSSFTPMFREALNIARKDGIHITYVAGCDLSKSSRDKNIDKDNVGLFDHIKLASMHATRSHVEYDRNMAYMIILDDCDDEPYYREFHAHDIEYVLAARIGARRSLVEIYPSRGFKLDLFNFAGEELKEVILKYAECLKIRVWWSGDESAI
jgi:hypothetical protein